MNIMRDTIWQFIFGFTGIGIAVLVYFLQRRKKSLSYQVMSEAPLLTVKEGLEGNIKIFFGEKPVPNVHLIILRILNDGNIPILPGDFQNNLRFSFGQKTTVLSAEVTDALPRTFKPNVTIESDRVVFQPTLLNGGDMATLKLLLAGYNSTIECDSRIVGVKDVKRVNENFNLSGLYTSIGAILFITGVVLFSVLFYGWAPYDIGFAFRYPKFILQFAFYTILVFVGLTLVVFGIPRRVKDPTR